MRFLGREGYLKLAKGMLDTTKQLLVGIDTIEGKLAQAVDAVHITVLDVR